MLEIRSTRGEESRLLTCRSFKPRAAACQPWGDDAPDDRGEGSHRNPGHSLYRPEVALLLEDLGYQADGVRRRKGSARKQAAFLASRGPDLQHGSARKAPQARLHYRGRIPTEAPQD